MSEYFPIFLQVVVAIGFAAGALITSVLLGKSAKTNKAKDSAYECGMPAEGAAQPRFSVKFYLVAMLFILFDIEIVFMYPFAVVFRQLGLFGLVEVLAFSVTVFAALLFLVSEGALSWGPVKHLTPGMPARTSSSTIVRIGANPEQAA